MQWPHLGTNIWIHYCYPGLELTSIVILSGYISAFFEGMHQLSVNTIKWVLHYSDSKNVCHGLFFLLMENIDTDFSSWLLHYSPLCNMEML